MTPLLKPLLQKAQNILNYWLRQSSHYFFVALFLVLTLFLAFYGSTYIRKPMQILTHQTPTFLQPDLSCSDKAQVCLFQRTTHPKKIILALASTIDDDHVYKLHLTIKNESISNPLLIDTASCEYTHQICVFQRTQFIKEVLTAISTTVDESASNTSANSDNDNNDNNHKKENDKKQMIDVAITIETESAPVHTVNNDSSTYTPPFRFNFNAVNETPINLPKPPSTLTK